MRHMIMIVSAFVLAQGTALADGIPDVGPPPDGGSCEGPVKQATECQTALNSCQQDVETLLPIVAACQGSTVDQVREDLKNGTLTTKPPAKPRKPSKPSKPRKPAGTKPAVKPEPGPAGPQGPKGDKGDQGDRGRDGRDAFYAITPEPPGKNCPNGCLKFSSGLDLNGNHRLDAGEVTNVVFGAMNGKDGKDGERGRDGYSRIQIETGMRFASIFSAGRPTGWSAAPELGMKYWLSPTVEFDLGAAWAPGDDRNMVITGQICRRGLGSSFGFCLGGQYLGWNLEGGLALWHSGLATAALKFVPVETRHVDLSFEAGGGVGFDGYDEDMQFAYEFTGRGALTVKF